MNVLAEEDFMLSGSGASLGDVDWEYEPSTSTIDNLVNPHYVGSCPAR